MTYFWAVMLDECGDEFGAGVHAKDKAEAREKLKEDYPESRGIVQIESPEDTAEREARMYRQMWDDDR